MDYCGQCKMIIEDGGGTIYRVPVKIVRGHCSLPVLEKAQTKKFQYAKSYLCDLCLSRRLLVVDRKSHGDWMQDALVINEANPVFFYRHIMYDVRITNPKTRRTAKTQTEGGSGFWITFGVMRMNLPHIVEEIREQAFRKGI